MFKKNNRRKLSVPIQTEWNLAKIFELLNVRSGGHQPPFRWASRQADSLQWMNEISSWYLTASLVAQMERSSLLFKQHFTANNLKHQWSKRSGYSFLFVDFMQNHTSWMRETFMATSAVLSETHDQLQRTFGSLFVLTKMCIFSLNLARFT